MKLAIASTIAGVVLKDVTAEIKSQDHELVDLTVNEVSLVTEPAILTDEESKNHAGFQVVKLDVSEEERAAAALKKAFEPRENEDYDALKKRLCEAARKRVAAETGDVEALYMSAMKVWSDKVLMGFWWEDDAPTLAADARVAYYHAYYTQDPTTKDFAITRVVPLVVTMAEKSPNDPAPAMSSDPSPDAEGTDSGAPNVSVEVEVEMASELAASTDGAAPEVSPEAAPAEATPAAPAVEEKLSVADMVSKLASSGQPFVLKMCDGKVSVEVGQPAAVEPVSKSADTTETDKLRTEKLALERERDELRQRVAKTNADEPLLVVETASSETKNLNKHPGGDTQFGRFVAAAIEQTILV